MATIANLVVALTAQTESFESGMSRAASHIQASESRFQTYAQVIRHHNAITREAAGVIDSLQTPMERLQSNMARLDDMRSRMLLTHEQHSQAVNKLISDYERANSTVGAFGEVMNTALGKFTSVLFIAQQVNRGFRSVADAMAQARREGDDVVETFGRIGQSLQNWATSIPLLGGAIQFIGELGGSLTGELQARQQAIDEFDAAEALYKQQKARADAVYAIINNLKAAASDDSVATIMGRAAGATETELMRIQQFEKAVESKRNVEAIEAQIAALERQAITFGMTEEQIIMYDLALKTNNVTLLQQAQAALDDIRAKREQAAAAEQAARAMEEQARAAQKLADDTERLIKSLEDQIATFGMSSREAEIWKLAQRGVGDEELERARKLDEQLKAMERQQEMMREGQRVFEQTRTPLEKYEEEIGRLSELLDAGAIDFETYSRAVRMARAQLEDANRVQTPNARAERRFVDRDAASAEAAQVQMAEPLFEVKRINDKMFQQDHDRNRSLDEIVRLIREQNQQQPEEFDI